ncbi:arginine--tRNA ligase [Litoribrevibacter albus]|uniref:Arginine--tRNA ligase n=1 Tax=Litoribrevibacter albus TaxID=1473156 RepID=A0AA37W8M7_9GAMM|nr:arginine--tRNA ligase [Litoribrevibacter albus]GLQ32189.1 arginine--tRNA ligase [Litoribrevibacter albus]
MNLRNFLDQAFSKALVAAGAPEGTQGMVRPSAKANFGDYQSNGVMPVAKKLGMNPREFAQQVVEKVALDGVIDKLEIAGPGFINIFLNKDWVADQLKAFDERCGVESQQSQTVAVDYSAPNVAKEMHVGHLRSTIIGDAVVRVLEFLGHKVVRCNHIGDWGTQFGMLIAHLEELMRDNPDVLESELSDLEEFYRQSKQKYDSDEEFAERARNYVVKLQGGDQWCNDMWRKLVDVTMEQNQKSYDRLNVTLTRDDVMGESQYNDMLPTVVADLKEKGLAVEDEGAVVVFLEEFKNKDGDPMGVIIQKKDGGFLYTTTDIACAKYRHEELGADRVLYFIDSRQAQHLQQAWTIVRKAGYVPETMSLEHHAFGMMLGKDGRPFKTRSGGVVKLSDLLDEAEQRATALIESKSSDLTDQQKQDVIDAVSIGAVKYADLSKNRTTDYIFEWDNMLSFDGNTAPYLQYAYTRVASVFRKAEESLESFSADIVLHDEAERTLAMKLMQFSEVVDAVAKEGAPHLLCTYLYELSGNFMTFYEACPINKEGVEAEVRASRLALCKRVANAMCTGLNLLGIKVVDRM